MKDMSKMKLFGLLIVLLNFVNSTDTFAQSESPWYFDMQATSYHSESSHEQQSLIGLEMLVQRSIGDQGFGLFAFAYHDNEFWGSYFGIVQGLGNLEFGLGIGPAEYGGQRWTVVNPWVYYTDGNYDGTLYLEYIAEESNGEEWFYKYHFYRSFGEHWFAGIYGERGLGAGPMLGINITKNLSTWLSTPVIDQPDEGQMRWLWAFTIAFD